MHPDLVLEELMWNLIERIERALPFIAVPLGLYIVVTAIIVFGRGR